MGQMEKYLIATPAIDSDSESIKEKAQSLTKNKVEITDKAKSLFYFVRDEIKYNPYSKTDRPEYFQASKTLERSEGFCIQKAVLLAALARAVTIPARLHFAAIQNHLIPDNLKEIIGTNIFPDHGYNELYLRGKWIKATTAFDIEMCQKNRFIPVEFDGKSNAIFHSHNLDGKPHIEYIKDLGHYDDLPFDMVTNLRIQALGPDGLERLKQAIEERNP